MNQYWRTMKSTFLKEMKVWKRHPRQLLLVILIPIMFWIAFNLLMGGVYSSGIDVALVVDEQNPGFYTNSLIDTLGAPDEIPPRLNLLQLSADEADLAFDNGDILLVITIPDGFEEAMAGNQSTNIHIRVNNMHEDQTKNIRMPVIRKLDIYYQTYLGDKALVDFAYEQTREYTYPRLGYMAWTISIYSIMFSSLYIAGSTVTQEFEQQTFDEIRLSNQSPNAIYLGKMLSGVALCYITVPVLLGLSLLQYGIWPNGDVASYFLLSIGLAFVCSAVGVFLGTVFRNSVYLVPTAAITGIFYWLIGGGIAPLQLVGLSFDVVDSYSPISNVYRALIGMFVDGSYSTFLVDLAVVWGFAIVFIAMLPIAAAHVSQIDYGRHIDELKKRRKTASARTR